MNTPRETTRDGFELQLGTNHLAHFLLFYLLKDLLISSSTPEFNSRLVNVASAGHKYAKVNFDDLNSEGAYDGWAAYGSSKTANIYMANELDRLYSAQGLHGYSVHPGAFESPNLQKHSAAEMEALRKDERTRLYMCSLQQACATSVYGAVSPTLEGRGPFYLEGASISTSVAPQDGEAVEYGYAAWAFDQASEERLWKVSKELVGML
jgi:NAD(P)-dependent dehydrogenase (short-subunit alcohol dehydrogenase family)